jgi:hypothetical protein
VPEEQAAGVGEVDAPRAARTVDELLADDLLELGDLLAHGRLRVAELARRGAEGAKPPDGLQGDEVAQFDASPSITLHNRFES